MSSSKSIDKNESAETKEGAWAAFGFALVLIVVGLPVWWTTTTVYRASLPYSLIDELASRTIYQRVHLSIIGETSFSKDDFESHLKIGLIQFLVSFRHLSKEEQNVLNGNSSNELKEHQLNSLFIHHSGSMHVYLQKDTEGPQTIFIGKTRLLLISGLKNLTELAETINKMCLDSLATDFLLKRTHRLQSAIQSQQRTSLLRQVPTEPGYDITLTLMLPQPHLLRAKWDAKRAIDEYLNPILSQMEDILDLRVRSQVLYMTSLKVSPKWSAQHKHFALPQQQLPLTINDIEAKLGSFVSTRSSLHFIIYIPLEHQIPLVIHNNQDVPLDSNSFFVPRWGGVLIYNPTNVNASEGKNDRAAALQEFSLNSHKIMRTVISQMHKLFPIPHLNITNSQSEEFSFAAWQLDSLARARVLMYLNNIKITLQSLRELVGEISNMVISDEVAGWIWAAVQDWSQCLDASQEGRLKEASLYCKQAFMYSDAAFFHPSMLALLYFPDNQKYAIYVPLFLPVSIPVILSFKMIFKYFSSKNKKSD